MDKPSHSDGKTSTAILNRRSAMDSERKFPQTILNSRFNFNGSWGRKLLADRQFPPFVVNFVKLFGVFRMTSHARWG